MRRGAFWTGVVGALVVMLVASLFQQPHWTHFSPAAPLAARTPTGNTPLFTHTPPPLPPTLDAINSLPGGPNQLPAGAPARPVSTPLSVGPPASSEPGDSPSQQAQPLAVIQEVRSTIEKYGSMFNGNPVGTNAEITRALNGDNPAHARFLDGIPGQQIDSNGELVDPWGTPYFFHQLSGSDMEVRSAGPDRKMWTSDDIVIH
jgi:hypothetical protein